MKGILYFRLNKKRNFSITSQNDYVSLFIKHEHILYFEGQRKTVTSKLTESTFLQQFEPADTRLNVRLVVQVWYGTVLSG